MGDKGFTLLEMAVTLAITAIIAFGASITTFQIIKASGSSQNLLTATNQANILGNMMCRDILTAQTVNATDDADTADNELVLISWRDWETGNAYDIRYIWLPSADSLQKLKRKQMIYDMDNVLISTHTTLVADNIYSANLTQLDKRWLLAVESRSGDKSLIREYIIGSRQGEQEY